MKKTVLLFVAVIIAASVNAQVYTGIKAGLSIPVGDYSSALGNPQDGFAKTGLMYGLDFGYKFNPYFDLALSVDAQSNPVNTYSLRVQLEKDLGSGIDHFYSDKWFVANATIRPQLKMPLGKFHFRIAPKAGIMLAKYPAMNFRDELGRYIFYDDTQVSYAIGGEGGAGVKLGIINLYTTMDILYGAPKFYITSNNGSSYYTQDITIIRPTLGIMVNL